MKLTFIQTRTFVSLLNHCGLSDRELRHLEQSLLENPQGGRVMRNTGGVRKVRFAPPSLRSGKSGGLRICYFYFPKYATVCFVLLFPKSEQPNLTPVQEKVCRLLSRQIEEAFEKTS